MTDTAHYRRELVGEVRKIHHLLSKASDRDLGGPSACSGWSVLDVGRHVEITPHSVAANIDAHASGEQPRTIERLSSQAVRAEVLASLLDGAEALDVALAVLGDDDLDGLLPGPAGPMPGRAALDLALTELTLHRCDIELGLGSAPHIDAAVAERLLDIVQAWLLLTAPADPIPDAPTCVELRGNQRSWFFSFDGSRWTDEECATEDVVDTENAAELVLAMAGRQRMMHPQPSTAAALSRLKSFLPGP